MASLKSLPVYRDDVGCLCVLETDGAWSSNGDSPSPKRLGINVRHFHARLAANPQQLRCPHHLLPRTQTS